MTLFMLLIVPLPFTIRRKMFTFMYIPPPFSLHCLIPHLPLLLSFHLIPYSIIPPPRSLPSLPPRLLAQSFSLSLSPPSRSIGNMLTKPPLQLRKSTNSKVTIWNEDNLHLHPDPFHR